MNRRRDLRRAVLADLAVSLVSGVLLTVGGSAVMALVGSCSDVPLTHWTFLVVAAVSFPTAYFLARRLTRVEPQVFMITSAFARTRWLAGLLDFTGRSLERHGIDLVAKFPTYDFRGQSQLLQLEAVRKKRRLYLGGLIVSSQPEHIQRELAAFCETLGLPTVFVDIRPFPEPQDYPATAAFVGCDPDEIGERAAVWVSNELRDAGREGPSVLVLGGDAQHGRHVRFLAKIRDTMAPSRLDLSLEGGFSRETAREIVDHHLRHLHRQGGELDVIYCTNDEMALGAVDAVKEHEARGNRYPGLFVVGVDGTPDALATIKSGATPFRATIVQDPRRLADTAVDLLLRMRAGEAVPTETFVTTTVYPSA